jgi:hypothetical protein
MEANKKDKGLLALYNRLKNSWERENYIEVCTFEERRGTVWWKMGIWRLKGMRGNNNQGICPVCRKEGATFCNVKNKELEGKTVRENVRENTSRY